MSTILHFIPTLEGGGAERQLALLARQQVRRGDVVHIGLRRGGPYAHQVQAAGVALHALGDHISFNPRLVWSMRALIRRLRPDVVQTWLPQADVCGGIAARLERTTWVMTERATRDAYAFWSAATWLRQLVAGGAQAIVANSRRGAQYWSGVARTRVPLEIVANGVDADAVRASMASTAARRVADGDLLLSAGRLIRSKGHDVTLRAFAALADRSCRLQVIGEGPERHALEALAVRLGIDERVELRPFDLAWWDVLRDARVVVSLSRVEGAPNVVLEAMVAGVPLLVSDIPEHREVLGDGGALFVSAGDAKAAAEAVRNILGDPDAAARRAASARDRAREFCGERGVAAYADLYRRLGAG